MFLNDKQDANDINIAELFCDRFKSVYDSKKYDSSF